MSRNPSQFTDQSGGTIAGTEYMTGYRPGDTISSRWTFNAFKTWLATLYIASTQKAAANGVATLDGSTKIPIAQLPASGVTVASYGDGTHAITISVDAAGRITSAANVAITAAGATQTTESLSVTGAGTIVTHRPTNSTDHLVYLSVGAGTYTVTGTLNTDNSPGNGNRLSVVVDVAANALPTINFQSGGTTIGTYTNPSGLAGRRIVEFAWDSTGTVWKELTDPDYQPDEVPFTIAAPSVGLKIRRRLQKPFTVSDWSLTNNDGSTSSIVLDIKKGTTTGALVSIVASAPPSVASADTANSESLTGWTPAWNKGDFIEVSVVSFSGTAGTWFLALGGTR